MKQIAVVVALMALTLFLMFKGILPAFRTLNSDFVNYYASAKLVTRGADLNRLYANEWFQDQIHVLGINTPGKFSPFPPITAWIMIPLTPFSPIVAQRIMTCLNLSALVGCAVLLASLTGWNIKHAFLLLLGGGLSLVNNIAFGQVYLIMLFFLLWSLKNFTKQPIVAGMLLGFFAVLKYFPMALLGGALLFLIFSVKNEDQTEVKKACKVFVRSSVVTISILILAQWLFFGTSVMRDYVVASLIPHLNGNLEGQNDYAFIFQSWDSLFRNLFVIHPTHNPNPFFDWQPGFIFGKAFVYLGILSVGMMAIQRSLFHSDEKKIALIITIISSASLAVLPASATYHFILILIPLALIARYDLLGGMAWQLLLILWVMIGFIPYTFFYKLGETVGTVMGYPRLMAIMAFYFILVLPQFRLRTVSKLN